MSKDLKSTKGNGQPPSSGNGKNGATLWIDENGFITDGSYLCPVKKGRYTITIFTNPSGQLRPSLQGYRPKSFNSKRVRENDCETLKETDAARDALILEDNNSKDYTRLARTSLSDEDLRDGESALKIISKLPPRDRNGTKWTFESCAEFTKENFKPCENRKLLVPAVDAFITMKDKEAQRAGATLDGIRTNLNSLLKAAPGKYVDEIPPETLKPLIIRGECVSTMKRHKSVFVDFFNWCSKSPRKWITGNPANEIALPDREDNETVPVILPIPDVLALLQNALQFKGGRLFLFCVCAVACALRPAELGRIQALLKVLGTGSFHFGERPDENYISIIGKGRKRRPVIIPPEFAPFIRMFVEAGYPIIPRNFVEDWTLLRATIGFLGTKDKLPRGFDDQALVEWVMDVLRHTAGTHHLNRYDNEFKTALHMGNSPKMIFRHYRGKATQKETEEFYQIPSKLTLPTLAELISAGIPEGATDSELKKLKCPVDRHTTFALKKSEFEKARDAHLKAHPETAIPALRMPARTKRRMLDLPKGDDLKKLFWTVPIHRLAKTKHVACATMALVAKDNGIILPEKGDWQKRAAGIPVVIPDEIAKLFPDGLPPYIAKVGRRPRVKYPELAECFKLTWQHSQTDLGGILKCSTASVERKIKELKLLVPGHSYWHAKPEHRTIPERIQYLLTLSSEDLRLELDAESLKAQPGANSDNAS
jgi:site-specific recombinase XerD